MVHGRDKVPDSGSICLLQKTNAASLDTCSFIALFSHFGQSTLLERSSLEVALTGAAESEQVMSWAVQDEMLMGSHAPVTDFVLDEGQS